MTPDRKLWFRASKARALGGAPSEAPSSMQLFDCLGEKSDDASQVQPIPRCTQMSLQDFATLENIRTVADFFQSQRFTRLGAIVSFKTAFPDELGPLPTIVKALQLRIL